MRKAFTAIDLFSGCGGLSLGLKRSGFDVRVAVEIDPLAAETYKKNHKGTVVIEQDVRNISGSHLRKAAKLGGSRLDLLAGCPPCQGFSRITDNLRKASDDPRNNLVLDFLRIAKELKPRIVLLENVPGLVKDRRFKRFTKSLEQLGYKCDWAILNAADYGVPQRRKRLIFIASALGQVGLPKKYKSIKTVRDYIAPLDRPSKSRDVLQRMHLQNTPRIKSIIAKIPKNGGSRSVLESRYQLECHKRTAGFRDVYGRMSWDLVSPTLTGGCYNPSKGRFLHPTQNRAITIREAALLQTFPKTYYFPADSGLSNIARMIGDALPPLFGEAQGKHILNHMKKYN